MPTPDVSTATPLRSRARVDVPPLDPLRYAPTPQRPLRAKWRRLAADTRVQPHSHPHEVDPAAETAAAVSADHGHVAITA